MTSNEIFDFFTDRQRFSRLDLNTNPSNDDMSAERRRQLKLSFQPESIKTIIKPQALPERTRYENTKQKLFHPFPTKCISQSQG